MESKKVFEAISKVMSDLHAIEKDRKNASQNYSFRGIDDFYNELQPHMARHGLHTVPEVLEERREERQNKSGGTLIYVILKVKYTFYAIDGSSVSAIVIGEGMDSGDKASNKAMSAAHKYALLQTFAVPTRDDKDSENDSPEPKPIQNTIGQADDLDKALDHMFPPQARPSAIPRVTHVTATPIENPQGMVTVESLASYDERDKAKQAGFRWDGSRKKWLKQIQASEMNSFPFGVRVV